MLTNSNRDLKVFSYRCIGESHKKDGKPCQDYTQSASEKDLTIAIICDGHGGDRYFRSDAGARIAAEVTEEAVREFLKDIDESVFLGRQFTAAGPGRPGKSDAVDEIFRQLFASIISKWNVGIEANAGKVKLDSWEKSHVEQKYLDEFLAGENLEKVYGCTLLSFVKTDKYWFAFHIGDGKCISFAPDGSWAEPIPWDERCFLNKTTSMCDSDAVDNFRYCYQGDGQFPSAVFLGSDGIDDSFGETDNLIDFYIGVLNEVNTSQEGAIIDLKNELPVLSARGSKDDMAIACVYDPEYLKELLLSLLQRQMDNVEKELLDTQNRKLAIIEKRDSLLSALQKESIELKYAISDLEKADKMNETLTQKKKRLSEKLETLLQNKKHI